MSRKPPVREKTARPKPAPFPGRILLVAVDEAQRLGPEGFQHRAHGLGRPLLGLRVVEQQVSVILRTQTRGKRIEPFVACVARPCRQKARKL